jgi:hypothetical protein
MADSKPTASDSQGDTPTADQLDRLTARVIARVAQGLSAAITAALEKSGLTERVEALAKRLEGLPADADSPPAEDAPEAGDEADRRICSEPGCDLPARARGLCSKHYQRLRYAEKRAQEAGEPLPKSLAEARSRRGRKPARKTEKRGGSICSQADCQRPTYAKGMCGKHFMEWVRAQKDLKAQQEKEDQADPD